MNRYNKLIFPVVAFVALVSMSAAWFNHKAVSAQAQTVTGPLSSETMAQTGTPTANSINCDATRANTLSGTLYLQRDATPGQRLWLCALGSDGVTYAWENLKGPFQVATTATITTGTILAGGCSTTTTTAVSNITTSFGVVGAPIFTGTIPTNPGLINIASWVSSSGIVSTQVCFVGLLGSLSSFTLQVRILVY